MNIIIYTSTLKTVNEIFVNSVTSGWLFSSNYTLQLEYLAHLSWAQAGDAIYQTAAILGKEYHSPHISLRKRHPSEPETPKTEAEFANISIHPNPANNKLHVTGLPEANCEIEIYDSCSRLLFKKLNAVNSVIIDLQDYSNGLYHLRVYNKNQNYRTNFVIMK